MVQLYSLHLSCGCILHLLPAFQVPHLYMAAMAGALQEGFVQLVLVLMAPPANWYCPDHAVWCKYLVQVSVRCPRCSCACVQTSPAFLSF